MLESVAGPAFEAEVEVELALSSFDDGDFDRERCGALLLAALLPSEEEAGGGPWLSSELLLADAAFDGWLLSLLFGPCELLSDRRGGGTDSAPARRAGVCATGPGSGGAAGLGWPAVLLGCATGLSGAVVPLRRPALLGAR